MTLRSETLQIKPKSSINKMKSLQNWVEKTQVALKCDLRRSCYLFLEGFFGDF
jgi:hypothetical protein